MDAELVKRQNAVREQPRQLADEMALLASNGLMNRHREPLAVNTARGWLERAHIVSRLMESIPAATETEKPVERLPWRLEDLKT